MRMTSSLPAPQKNCWSVRSKPCVEAFLAERGLELSKEKTKITHISEGFDFLGQNVRKYGGKLLIKPSVKNVKSVLGESPRDHQSEPLDEAGSPD